MTPGRVIFNEAIPQNLGFVDRTEPGKEFDLEINELVDKKILRKIVDACYHIHGNAGTCDMLDRIKKLGFNYSTKGAITVSVSDVTIPEAKKTLLEKADSDVLNIEKQYRRGLISNEERYEHVVDIWQKTTQDVTDALMESLDAFNPIYMMATSGARGDKNQIRQLAGMRGLMADPSGQIIEVPIRANFREGLTVLEFFNSTHGARKGLADTALRTADSGYLTRRLVDVSQDVIVREKDCFERTGEKVRGIEVKAITEGAAVIEPFRDRIEGRYAAQDVVHPVTGEVLAKINEMITHEMAGAIVKAGIESVEIRSVLTCRTDKGVCAKCYGANMATGDSVPIGGSGGDHRGPVHRRTGYPAHHADIPYRRRGPRGRHHPGSAPRRGTL